MTTPFTYVCDLVLSAAKDGDYAKAAAMARTAASMVTFEPNRKRLLDMAEDFEGRAAVAATPPEPTANAPVVDPFVRSARVVRWIDGDTLVALIDYGYRQSGEWVLRLRGVDTPERREPGHDDAREFASSVAPPGSAVTVRTFKPAPETFGRYVADLWNADGYDVAEMIRMTGWSE